MEIIGVKKPKHDRTLYFYFTIYLLYTYLETNFIILCKCNKCLVLMDKKWWKKLETRFWQNSWLKSDLWYHISSVLCLKLNSRNTSAICCWKDELSNQSLKHWIHNVNTFCPANLGKFYMTVLLCRIICQIDRFLTR